MRCLTIKMFVVVMLTVLSTVPGIVLVSAIVICITWVRRGVCLRKYLCHVYGCLSNVPKVSLAEHYTTTFYLYRCGTQYSIMIVDQKSKQKNKKIEHIFFFIYTFNF